MRVVVIGATGNVGSRVTAVLAADPEVDSLLAVARRTPDVVPPGVEFASADVAADDLEPLLRGADAVVHLAWLIQPGRDEWVTESVNVGGSRRVFDAAVRAGVPALVYASSVGAYAPGPKDREVDESWPATGIASSFYSRHKAAVERLLDVLEREHPELRVVRLRPGLIFQRAAATEIRRLFIGPLLPGALLRPELIPVVPEHPRLRVQAVHTDDVADAYRRAVLSDARGAFNVAAEPVLDGPVLASLLGSRALHASPRVLRAAAALSFRLRLQPSEPGWLDMGLGVPLMSSARARNELGWSPAVSATDAVVELLDGLQSAADGPTPPLARSTTGPLRWRELATGVGRRP
ncbi:MAG TPA: NAD-dependent epimerase/dehydratase family protein [Solirubrobacteraceae bacterium]|nr:NAD-dependent epimerase/dehydratase family protein [Solirubrobacteraceae bacterium]